MFGTKHSYICDVLLRAEGVLCAISSRVKASWSCYVIKSKVALREQGNLESLPNLNPLFIKSTFPAFPRNPSPNSALSFL